jgi:membrane protein YdbS with pleckstrin-like domain
VNIHLAVGLYAGFALVWGEYRPGRMTIPPDLDDGVVWGHPSPRLLTLRRWEVAVVAAVALALGVSIPLALHDSFVALVVTGAVALAGLGAFRFVSRRVRAWGFAERDEDLLVRRGVMFRRMSVIPYGRMQYLEVTAGPFERSVGLATVQMHTAAAASDAKIPGLPAAEAARLRDQLTSLGESQAAGL